eukprot:TRINITY_DN1300_c0_g1_i1.p1 TRINITY_DN1300_c0_g1~~TRINITY_DN1300_c0_g1_i1.p1  ORF type:complete len:195 (-),score=45.76 TRINITY_DN1300_c0_g1_i1:590-1174(-)
MRLVWSVVFFLSLLFAFSSSSSVHLNDANFNEEVAKGESLVYFFASWCTICQTFHPIFEAIASDLSAMRSSIRVAKIEAPLNPQISAQEKVDQFPSIRFYSNGKMIATFSGERTSRQVIDWAQSISVNPAMPHVNSPSSSSSVSNNESVKSLFAVFHNWLKNHIWIVFILGMLCGYCIGLLTTLVREKPHFHPQ